MPTLTELQEKRGTLIEAARERLNQISASTDDARARELETQHDAAMVELDRLDASIKREETLAAAERRQEELRSRQRPNPGDGETRGADDPDKPVEYRHAFHRWVQVGGDMASLSDEERSVLRAGVAPKEIRAQTTSATAGGYTVPTELANQIIVSMKAWGRCTTTTFAP